MPHKPVGQMGRAWVALILVLAAAVRLGGLGFGLPAVYNPDEVAIMNRAVSLGQNGLNPHNFLYPSLYFYALFAWEGGWYLVGRAAGVFDSLAAFERAFFVDPTSIYLAGRALSVVCGVLTVWVSARLAARLFGEVAARIAGLLLAVAPVAVRDAHYVKHDVPVTLLVMLTHFALVTVFPRAPSPQRWIWPGVLAGLAMSVHYYAVFLAVPLAVAAVWPAVSAEPRSLAVRRLLFAAVATSAAFFAGSPFLLAEPTTALRDIIANREIVVDRLTTSTGAFGALSFYVNWLAHDAAGGMTAVLALVGLGCAWTRGWIHRVIALAFPVTFLLFIANTVPASRYLNPLLPFVAILAGAGGSCLLRRQRAVKVAGLLLVAGAALEAGAASVRADAFFRQADTRTLARDWFEQTVQAGSSVLIQPYSVPLRQSREGLEEALTRHLGAANRASVRFQRQLALTPYPEPAYRLIYLGTGGLDVDKIYVAPLAVQDELEPIRALAVTHVILKRYHVEDPSTTGLRRTLEREGRLLATFSPYREDVPAAERSVTAPFLHNTDVRIAGALERPGPIIEVWRIER